MDSFPNGVAVGQSLVTSVTMAVVEDSYFFIIKTFHLEGSNKKIKKIINDYDP